MSNKFIGIDDSRTFDKIHEGYEDSFFQHPDSFHNTHSRNKISNELTLNKVQSVEEINSGEHVPAPLILGTIGETKHDEFSATYVESKRTTSRFEGKVTVSHMPGTETF